ncbi:MAG: hypothetical protein R3272_14825 [Candidatus Promineifilaceae bacterium]|nr:hypothetical protein [Candidatus Promineifilaceae bacterium]
MKEELQQALAAIKVRDEESARLILVRLLKQDPDNVGAWILLSRMAETEVQKVAFLRKVLAIDPEQPYARHELARLAPTPVGESAESVESMPEAPVEAATEAPGEVERRIRIGGVAVYDFPEVEEESTKVAVEPVAVEEEVETEAVVVEGAEEAEEAFAAEAGEEAAVEEPEVTALPVSTQPDDYEAQAEGDTIPPWLEGEAAATGVEPAPESAPRDEDVEAVPEWLEEQPDEAWLAEAEAEPPAIMAQKAPATPQPEKREAAVQSTGGANTLLLAVLAIAALLVFVILVYQLLLLVG